MGGLGIVYFSCFIFVQMWLACHVEGGERCGCFYAMMGFVRISATSVMNSLKTFKIMCL